MQNMNEDTRQQLISKGKSGAKYRTDRSRGDNRYKRRVWSKISNSVKEYNKIDMNKFFKEDILDVNVPVIGETDDYLVTISFGGVLDNIKENVKRNNDVFDLKSCVRALITAFNSENVYIRCNCPDAKYRFDYFQSVTNIIAGTKQTIPSDITNPNNTLGSACKHVLMTINNTSFFC